MKVLLSIKPEYAREIFSGSKKYEYRRSIFKTQNVTHIVVYASLPVGKIVGEFEIEDVIYDDVKVLWMRTKASGGISEEEYFSYFSNKERGYAIQIGRRQRYQHPLSPEDKYGLTPPQSFAYLER